MSDKELAEIAFDAYNKQAGGKTWDGKDIPPFKEVGEKVQANWRAAVNAVSDALGYGSKDTHEVLPGQKPLPFEPSIFTCEHCGQKTRGNQCQPCNPGPIKAETY